MDSETEVCFIAGPMDGKELFLVHVNPEVYFPVLNHIFTAKDMIVDEHEIPVVDYKRAVYKYIGHGAYLFSHVY